MQRIPAQVVEPVPGDPLSILGTFLLGWAFFAFTAQIAASYFLADAPWTRAVAVGIVPATVTMALVRYDPAVIILVGLAADFAAFHLLYRLRYRTTALVVVMHYTASIVLVLLVATLIALFGTAPG